ncbi:hypothetical protein PF008_g26433 [Phytophthora fragariae]|uniref:Uncharacterized protein n=1 Tax=Phytophthora fragariae TaxID=53985 RepID=A0A6G0QH25_9STRA|nr:hypothetical protein PF008_g26433 [Phytophthora fragariae]
MALTAKLRDVEQQLLRVTKVVELHLELTERSLKCEHDDITPISEVLLLVESVERAQTDLVMVTQHLVEIVKRHLPALTPALEQRSIDGDETETDDELEEVPQVDKDEQAQNRECGDGDNRLNDFTLEDIGLEQDQKSSSTSPLSASSIFIRNGGSDEDTNSENVATRSAAVRRDSESCQQLTANPTNSTTDEVAIIATTAGFKPDGEGHLSASTLKNALQRYLAAARSMKNSTTNLPLRDPGSTSNVFENADALAVDRWTTAVKQDFKEASRLFLKRLSRQSTSRKLVASFCEASELAVSRITFGKTRFNMAWVVSAIVSFDAVHVLTGATPLTQSMLPVLECRNTLVRFVDERISTFLGTTSSNLSKLTETSKKLRQLRSSLLKYGEKFHSICQYCIIRYDVDDMKPWTSEQWELFLKFGQHLSNLTKYAYKTQKLPGWVSKLSETLEKFDAVYPGRSPKLLLELCGVRDTKTERDGQVVDSSPNALNFKESGSEVKPSGLIPAAGNIHADVVGAKRAREDTEDDLPEAKRLATSPQATNLHDGDDAAARRVYAEVKGCLDMATQLKGDLEVGELVLPFSQAAKEIQCLLHRVIKLGKHFSRFIAQDEESVVAFCEMMGILVELIWLCRCGTLGHAQLKGLVKQLPGIIKIATKSDAHLNLAASYRRAQAYWNEFHADQFQAMRNHVNDTEREITDLDPTQLQTPLRQLFVQFLDTCDVSLQELNPKTAYARIQELQLKLFEMATVLNKWLERTMGAGQLLNNHAKFWQYFCGSTQGCQVVFRRYSWRM